MTTLINLTPHTINLCNKEGEVVMSIPSSGNARVSVKPGQASYFDGVPVPVFSPSVYGEVQDLPDPVEGIIYIVSMMVAQRCPNRVDVVGPDSGPTAVRKDGQIVGVRGLVRY